MVSARIKYVRSALNCRDEPHEAQNLWISARIPDCPVVSQTLSKVAKVGLMHDPTMSRDLRDNGRILTKILMASAGGGNLVI